MDAAAETLLARPDVQVTSLAVPRLMLEAEMKLEQGRPVEALGILHALKKEAGAHTAALRLELRALQGTGRYAEIPPLVDALVKRKVYGAAEAEFVRAAAHAEELTARGDDASVLRAYWARLSDAEQRHRRSHVPPPRASPPWASSAKPPRSSRGASSADGSPITSCSTRNAAWPTRCRNSSRRNAGSPRHSQDPALLYALGVLCERAQLWSKAQTYLEASLALDDAYRTHVALGELFVHLDRDREANVHLAAALKLALAELET